MHVPMDIETIPNQKSGSYEEFLKRAREDFKPPSTLTKQQAAIDLGITDAKDIKFTSKEALVSQWVECFKDIKSPDMAEDLYRKTGLDGNYGEIISIVAIAGEQMYSNYRLLKGKFTEKELLSDFLSWVWDKCQRKAHHTTPFFIGHNIPFDLKFLFKRAVILGLAPKFDLPFNGLHGRHYFCNSQAWCSKGERISQNDLAHILGIEGKPDDIDGSKVWDFVKRGEEKRVNQYNEYDVNTVVKIYNRLHFEKDLLWLAA